MMGTESNFFGKILHIDLTDRKIRTEQVDPDVARSFIGGWGLNAKLAYDLVPPRMDAFSQEMPIILGAGVLNGTACPSAPKSFLTTKCPSAGTVTTAVGSLNFGAAMKWAGYENIVLNGKSETPVYLHVENEKVEIRDASDLWGKDLYETTNELRARHGGQGKCSVICIGPAGEQLVRTSIILIDKCSTLGRTNAANFGAKNLKAVVVNGSYGIRVAEPKRFMKTANLLFDKAWKDPLRPMWVQQHLFAILPMWLTAGHILERNFTQCLRFEETNKHFGGKQYLKFKRKTISCPACLAADKGVLCFGNQNKETYTSTPMVIIAAASFGVDDMETAIELFDRANRYGIDYVTFPRILDFTIDLYEQGIINKGDTGGLELRRDYETISTALELVKANRGFGEVLSQGWIGAIKKIGRGCEKYAHHIKGTDPDFDARVSFGVEVLGQVTNPRGAHDMPIGGLTVAPGREAAWFKKVVKKMGFPPESMDGIFVEPGFDVGKLLAHYENWATILNSLGICFRMQSSSLFNIDICAELYSAVTGRETGPEELRLSAERGYTLYKMLNVREGFDRKDDTFPEKWFEPLKNPDKGEALIARDYFQKGQIFKEDADRILGRYYEEKGWDTKTGIPREEKLRELGLETLIHNKP